MRIGTGPVQWGVGVAVRVRTAVLLASFLLFATRVRAQPAQEREEEARGEVNGSPMSGEQDDDFAETAADDAALMRRVRRFPTTFYRDPTPIVFRSESGRTSIEFGMLLGSTFQVSPIESPDDGSDGFYVDNARIAFWGQLVEGFDYLLQLELARLNQPLLDLRLGFEPVAAFRVDVGLFKVPFSAEFLLPDANTTLIDRAQVVSALAPNRQAGVQVSGEVGDGKLAYAVGAFNGNTFGEPDALTNVDNKFLYVGRVESRLELADIGALEIGANVAGGVEDQLTYPFVSPLDPTVQDGSFGGKRVLVGGDLSVDLADLSFSAEGIGVWLDPDDDAAVVTTIAKWVWGYHVTVGYSILEQLGVYARWDSFNTTAFGASESSDLVIFSVATGTRGATALNAQLDYVLPVRDTDSQWILLNVFAVY